MDISLISRTWPGRVIDGKFPLLKWLGSSASSGVFLCEVEGHAPRKFALKLISADTLDAEIQMTCWASTTALSHPHLMALFHTGRCQIDDAWFIYAVTEYAEEFLSQVLAERPLTVAETTEMFNPVVDALAYLHKNGVVHGRIKPANIMGVNDRLKISSERLHLAGELRNPDAGAGAFDAPELASGAITPAADVWSLGITLIKALTQWPPVWESREGRDPVVPESIPEPFAEIARGCLRCDPSRRFTLGEVKARLGSAQALPDPPPSNAKRGPNKSVAALLIAAVLAVIAVIAAVHFRSHKAPASSAEEQPSAELASLPPQAAAQEAPDTQTSPESRSQDTSTLSPATKKKPAAGTALVASQPTETQTPAAQTQAPAAQTPAAQTQTSNDPLVKGAVAQRVSPDILPSAMESIDGKVDVKIRVAVDPSGKVSSATYDSPGTSRYFAKMTLQAAQQWQFSPAHVDGQPVSSVWILAFEFTQAGTEITPVEVSP
jgi:TonB family protein